MKVAILNQDGFRIEDRERPVPSPHEVLVETMACGICGGDQHAFKVREHLKGSDSYLGHEGTGTIAAIGANVTGLSVGDVVTSLHGGFADYFVSPANQVYKLPPAVDPLHALGEPVACCVHASWRFGVREGDEVAIVGCGFMGLICMQLARLQGASKIVAIDPVAYRRNIALELGADQAAAPDQLPNFDADEGLYDIVIEAAGVASSLALSTDLVKHHGTVSLIGYHESNDGMRSVNMQRWNYKAISVINGHVRRDDEKQEAMIEGVDLIAAGKLKTAPLVKEYPLDNISDAFDNIFSGDHELFKVILIPDHKRELN